MSKSTKGPGNKGEPSDVWAAVSEAASVLEGELRKFEQLGSTARKLPIETRKGIERAARAVAEAAEGQEHVNTALTALVRAIGVARERHEANAAALTGRGEEIRARAEQVSPLYTRFAALGDEGREANEHMQEAAAMQRDAKTPEQLNALVAAIEGVEGRMSKLVDDARELTQDANRLSASDVAEQTDSLRQQAASAKNKLGMLKQNIAALVPAGSKPN